MEKIKLLLYAIFAYLHIDKETFIILMVLMSADSIVGALKAIRLGEEFKFKKLLWGMTMKLVFLIVPLTLALIGKSLDYDFRLAVNIVISVLTVSEGYSILGNIYSAKNRVEVKKIDAISKIIESIRHVLSTVLENFLNSLRDLGNK